MTFAPAPQITADSLVPSRGGSLAYQLVTLAGGLPGRVWLYYHHRLPTESSEYYIEVFDRNTLSWGRVCHIEPATVGDLWPNERADRLQAVADELFATANAVLSAALDTEGTTQP